MILGSPQPQKTAGAGGRITLDEFRAALAQRPDDLALIDPPHREAFTAGAPRQLTYVQADRAITAIAARLHRDGLVRDQVVALQMPNTVESVLVLLGVLRAGLIASPLPLLWRQADCSAAVAAVGARALITMGRVGSTDHGALAATAKPPRSRTSICSVAPETAPPPSTIRWRRMPTVASPQRISASNPSRRPTPMSPWSPGT
jgi:acyl-CoA synthetase (AMP-forming)/AMP-acid ligase II